MHKQNSVLKKIVIVIENLNLHVFSKFFSCACTFACRKTIHVYVNVFENVNVYVDVIVFEYANVHVYSHLN